MNIDSDKLLFDAIRDGLRDGIKEKLSKSYNNPLDALLTASIEKHGVLLRQVLDDSLAACLKDANFKEDIASGVRHKLASVLISRFGGELEKQVNVLKSDPTTRARITLAIEAIVKEKSV